MLNIFKREKRKYLRHPLSVPIRLRIENDFDSYVSESRDVSLGGLCFVWPSRITKGSMLTLSIPVKEKVFDIRGKVAYSRTYLKTNQFQTGVAFIHSPDAFKARIAEEVLEIMEYQKSISRELGRQISEEEAAKKWVHRYAGRFTP